MAVSALETALRDYRRNGRAPNEETRQFALALATAVLLVAATLPALLDAVGPQQAAAVKTEARRMAASRADRDGAGPTGSGTAALSASEAARIAGVSSLNGWVQGQDIKTFGARAWCANHQDPTMPDHLPGGQPGSGPPPGRDVGTDSTWASPPGSAALPSQPQPKGDPP